MDPRIPWVPPRAEPCRLIGSQSALGQIVERVFGTELACFDTKRFPDGFTDQIEMPEELRAELTIAAGTHTAAYKWAYDWLKRCLETTALELFRVSIRDLQESVGGPLVIDACRSDFWGSPDPTYVALQYLLLARDKDPAGKWAYLFDEAVLTALLDTELGPLRLDANVSTARAEEPGVQGGTDENEVPKPKKRRVRNVRVKELIAEGVRLVKRGEETMHSAAKLIAKRDFSKKLAASEDALVDQIRRGISAELKRENSNG